MLNRTGCLERQKRLRAAMAEAKIDAALITDARDVYYFSGKPFGPPFATPVVLCIQADGGSWLVAPGDDQVQAADEVLVYERGKGGTSNLDWNTRLVEKAVTKLRNAGYRRVGFEGETMTRLLGEAVDKALKVEWVDIEPAIVQLQRKKEEDELKVIRDCIRWDLAAYNAVRDAIRPGVTELEVLEAGHRAATLAAGERIYHDGDYQAAQLGGFARNRPLQAGEMYVVDAWIMYRCYWADLCRTFMVGNKPTDVQQSAYDHVAAAHKKITPMFTPGTRGTEIFKATDEWIRQHPAFKASGLQHHAGHGLGIRVHMDPDLNRDREGILQEGDVICFEPGGYNDELGVHVRLENTYVVTSSGPQNLVDYPFELVRPGR